MYEQGKVRHLGAFPVLEDQMCGFARDPGSWSGAGFDRRAAGASPDRVDALVWALSDLLLQAMPNAGIFELYRQSAGGLHEPQNQYERGGS